MLTTSARVGAAITSGGIWFASGSPWSRGLRLALLGGRALMISRLTAFANSSAMSAA